MKQSLAKSGAQPYAKITAAHIVAGRDYRSKTPHQARHFVTTMRGLFRWALERQYVKVDPTVAVSDPELPETVGFAVWEESDVATYESRWPIGTRQRIWLDLLIYTGLRRGDAVRVGRQHVKKGVIKIKTEKTGTDVTLPILAPLQRTLDAGPCGELAFITGENGKPFKKESFGNAFSDACRAAGLKSKSAHGLRKAAAVRAALAGATVPEMNSMFGWSGTKMALHYIESADRERLSAQGMAKVAANIG